MLNLQQSKEGGKRGKKKRLYEVLSLLTVSFFHLWILPRMPDVTDSSPTEGGFARKKAVMTVHTI